MPSVTFVVPSKQEAMRALLAGRPAWKTLSYVPARSLACGRGAESRRCLSVNGAVRRVRLTCQSF
eukprot:scaffold1616_cov310-Pinguiococcus_pyrenoidosus.AAC.20